MLHDLVSAILTLIAYWSLRIFISDGLSPHQIMPCFPNFKSHGLVYICQDHNRRIVVTEHRHFSLHHGAVYIHSLYKCIDVYLP